MPFQGTNRFNKPWDVNNRTWVNYLTPLQDPPPPPDNTKIFRGPLIVRIAKVVSMVALLSQAPVNLLTNTLADAGPPPDPPRKQTQWDNPRGPQFPVSLRTHTYNFPPDIQKLTIPDGKSTFPEPRGPAYPISLRTHLHDNVKYIGRDKFFGGDGQTPAYDYPNPRARRVQQPEQAVNLLGTTLAPAVQAPFRQNDWPNPVVKSKFYAGLKWSSNSLIEIEVDFPIGSAVLPDPQRKPFPISLRTWTSTVQPPAPAVQAPFRQNDWPNPITRPKFLAGQKWSSNGLIEIEVDFPIGSATFPEVRGKTYPVSLKTWTLSVTHLLTPPVKPFKIDNWPLPNPKPRYRQYIHGELTNPNLFPPAEVVVATGQKEKRKWRRGSA